VNYGEGWFKERGFDSRSDISGTRSVEYLRQHGYCLDNLYPDRSTISGAGRGAFARRDLEEGRIVAPIPLIALKDESLRMAKEHESGRVVVSEQLLRNYCFGHHNSSILLYPYSPMINLINHASGDNANVKPRWNPRSKPLFDLPFTDLQDHATGLLMELVATKPIKAGEEILLDYGKEWENAWEQHMRHWSESRSGSDQYTSSQTANADDRYRVLKTAMELQSDPYPENLFTSCYFRYSLDREAMGPNTPGKILIWKDSPGLTKEPRNLRPCVVMNRHPAEDGEMQYTVRMLNRPGLIPVERIPKGQPCVVTAVPRHAVEFSDKMYTTDQHLEHAFRKEIGLDIFPYQWKDLTQQGQNSATLHA